MLPLFFLALASCGDGGVGPQEVGVGEEGGTVSLASGSVTLSVPPAALAGFVEITASQTSSVPQSDLLVPGSAYEIGPLGTTFDRLATLTLTYDSSSLPDGVRESELRLYHVVGSAWEPSQNSSVDVSRHTVSGLIGSLGTFGAMALPVSSVESILSFYTLSAGETKHLTAVGKGPSGEFFSDRKVTWGSSSESVATVDTTGLVTAVGAGTATITASVESKSADVTIRVFDCPAQAKIPATECQALIAIYGALTEGEWRSSGEWVRSPNPCDWQGVTCEGSAVSGFILPGRQYSGSIPFSIGDLSNLKSLEMSTNRISGRIPASIGSLTKLEYLSLASNDLSGPIPPELGNLEHLTELKLYWNQLSGPIPPELGALTNLTELRVNGNQLSGPIPPEFGNLSSLVNLSLLDNQLSGSIPPELGALSNLEGLSLSINELSGRIPPELGNLSNLTNLGLSRNRLTGAIPAELGSLTNVERLFLQENQLAGAVPKEVAQLGGAIQGQFNRSDCVFVPPGNEGLTLPDTEDSRNADLDGDGAICGLAIGS